MGMTTKYLDEFKVELMNATSAEEIGKVIANFQKNHLCEMDSLKRFANDVGEIKTKLSDLQVGDATRKDVTDAVDKLIESMEKATFMEKINDAAEKWWNENKTNFCEFMVEKLWSTKNKNAENNAK